MSKDLPAHNRAKLTGMVFYDLTVIGSAGSKEHGRSKEKKAVWTCRCACGKTTTVSTRSLKSGNTKSCGCRSLAAAKARSNPLKAQHPRTYRIWQAMLNRCRRKGTIMWHRYGGRGIKVCPRWKSFRNFITDMGPVSGGRSIERLNNNGDYEPGNCVWETRNRQSRNKSSNRVISFNGETKILKDWADQLGIDQASLRERLQKWPIGRALTEPPRRPKTINKSP